MTGDPKEVLNIQQAHDLSAISVDHLRTLFRDGSIPARNVGGRSGWLTTRRAVLAYIEGGNQPPKENEHAETNETDPR